MRRVLLILLLGVASLVVLSLATAGAVRAEDEGFYPACRVTANDPYTDGGTVLGWGGIHCSAGGDDWGARWTLEVCLQKWVRPDDQYYDVSCTSDWTVGEERRIGAMLIAPRYCSEAGYGEFRLFVHGTYFVDGWQNVWAISNVTWNCT